MLGRKKAFDESVADYKLSLVKARERKKATQGENGEYWRNQMDWKRERGEQEYRDSQYDPETMWNVEEATRRKFLMDKKQNDQANANMYLTQQGNADKQRRNDNR